MHYETKQISRWLQWWNNLDNELLIVGGIAEEVACMSVCFPNYETTETNYFTSELFQQR